MKYCLIAIALLYACFLIFFGLSEFPGLHGDEAWLGIYASEMLEDGLRSIHGMNTYSGSIYSWIVSIVFRCAGINVLTLRMAGALCNVLGLFWLTIHFWKYVSVSASFVFLSVVFASPFFFLYSRVAWEVCALQFLLLATRATILLKIIHDKQITFVDCAVFFGTSLFGVWNHFIFISECLGLLVSSFLTTIISLRSIRRNNVILSILLLTFLNMIFVSLLFLGKPRIDDAFFAKNRFLTLLSPLLAIVGFSVLFVWLNADSRIRMTANMLHRANAISQEAIALVKKSMADRFPVVVFGIFLLTLGVVAVRSLLESNLERTALHGKKCFWGFFGSLTSVIPIERIMIYQIGPLESVVFHSFWIGVFALLVLVLFRRVGNNNVNSFGEESAKLIFLLWPLFSLLALPFMVDEFSGRYYLISCCLFLIACPILWDDVWAMFPSARALVLWPIVVLALASFLLSQSIFFQTFFREDERESFEVTYGTYRDSSAHFLPSRELFEYLKANNVCEVVDTSFFIAQPIQFYFRSEICSNARDTCAQVSYCPRRRGPVKNFAVQLRELP